MRVSGTGRLVSLQEAAEALNVSVATVRRHVSAGRLPAYRLGPRLIRVDSADLDAGMRRVSSGRGRVA